MNQFIFLLSRILKVYGKLNVQFNSRYEPVLMAKINRKDPTINYIYFMIAFLMILICLAAIYLPKMRNEIVIGFFVFMIIFILSIVFFIRLKQGDTVIISGAGIEEINWLTYNFIKSDEILEIYIYELGPLSNKLSKYIPFKFNRDKFYIKGKNDSIAIGSAYPDIDEIRTYFLRKYREIIVIQKIEPVYRELAIVSIIGIVLILYVSYQPLREFLKEIIINIIRS